MHWLATHFPAQQKRGGRPAVDDYAFARIKPAAEAALAIRTFFNRDSAPDADSSACRAGRCWVIASAPLRTFFPSFAASSSLLISRRAVAGENSQTLNDFLNGHKAQLCEHFQEDFDVFCAFSHESYSDKNLIFLDDI